MTTPVCMDGEVPTYNTFNIRISAVNCQLSNSLDLVNSQLY